MPHFNAITIGQEEIREKSKTKKYQSLKGYIIEIPDKKCASLPSMYIIFDFCSEATQNGLEIADWWINSGLMD